MWGVTICTGILSVWEWETFLTCSHTFRFRTPPLTGTDSGMVSDSVHGRGINVVRSGQSD